MENRDPAMTLDQMLSSSKIRAELRAYLAMIHARLNTLINQDNISAEAKAAIKKEIEKTQTYEAILAKNEKIKIEEMNTIMEHIFTQQNKYFSEGMERYYKEQQLRIALDAQALEENRKTLSDRMEQWEKTQRQKLDELKETITKIQATIRGLQESIQDHRNRISKLRNEIGEINTVINQEREHLKENENLLEAQAIKLNIQKEEEKSTALALEKTKEELNEINQDILKAKNELDRAQQGIDPSEAEKELQLIALRRDRGFMLDFLFSPLNVKFSFDIARTSEQVETIGLPEDKMEIELDSDAIIAATRERIKNNLTEMNEVEIMHIINQEIALALKNKVIEHYNLYSNLTEEEKRKRVDHIISSDYFEKNAIRLTYIIGKGLNFYVLNKLKENKEEEVQLLTENLFDQQISIDESQKRKDQLEHQIEESKSIIKRGENDIIGKEEIIKSEEHVVENKESELKESNQELSQAQDQHQEVEAGLNNIQERKDRVHSEETAAQKEKQLSEGKEKVAEENKEVTKDNVKSKEDMEKVAEREVRSATSRQSLRDRAKGRKASSDNKAKFEQQEREKRDKAISQTQRIAQNESSYTSANGNQVQFLPRLVNPVQIEQKNASNPPKPDAEPDVPTRSNAAP